MATRKNTYKYAKKVTKDISKSVHSVTIICCIIFLIVGIILGVVISSAVTKNDIFCLNGEIDINIVASEHEGDEYYYVDDGVKAISFGKDVSNTVIVTTNLEKNANGEYIVPLNKSGTYTITYTIDCIKSRFVSLVSGTDVALVRTIVVEE